LSRFIVSYQIYSHDKKEVDDIAESITLEETVEIPKDIVPKGFIQDEIVGRVENIISNKNSSSIVEISYSAKSVGKEILQLLNVIHGNSSMFNNVKVVDIKLNNILSSSFPGAKFGIEGVRKILNHKKPIIAPVIKPQGLSSDDLSVIAYKCALAGADLVKEDHNLVNQSHSSYRERVDKISSAVKKGNKESGNQCLYFPHIASNFFDIEKDIKFAQDFEVGGIMLIPSLVGYNLVHSLAQSDKFNLPILTHPSFSGANVLSNNTGFSFGMFYGKIQRLIGSDMSIFPNVGGRFNFTKDECQSIALACRSSEGPGKPILPSIGGGMSLKTADSMKNMYGNDAIFLLGGSLLRYGDRIGEGILDIKKALY
jgi:ribulose-bisphosphate carboxylase large chain